MSFKSSGLIILCLLLSILKTIRCLEQLYDEDFDYLLYSQRWPITSCSTWRDENVNHTCNLPQQLDTWNVHGIWPTKTGTEGPNNCPSAIHFDPDQLTPIMDELQERWTNIEADTKPDSFWKHEWGKHGTCASVLPELNSVKNYFQQGLTWNQVYNITDALAKGNIIPNNDGYSIEEIINSIKTTVGTTPQILCANDKKHNTLLSEIRICFDKSLSLIDCPGNNANLNCSPKKQVMYYGSFPMTSGTIDDFNNDIEFGEEEAIIEESYAIMQQRQNLLYLYRLLRLIIYFTF